MGTGGSSQGEAQSSSQLQTVRLQRIQRTRDVPDRVGPGDRGALGQLESEWRSEPSRHMVPQPTTTPATTPIESPN